MERRDFIKNSALAGIALALPVSSLLDGCMPHEDDPHSFSFKKLSFELLKEWCDGMISLQNHDSSDPKLYGSVKCLICNDIHVQFSDSVYPLFHLAKVTGEDKYLQAGIAAFDWTDHNVSLPDSNKIGTANADFMNNTTVFGAIALAETLKYHSDLLDSNRLMRCNNRLNLVADFLVRNFPKLDVININYGAKNIYALHLIGQILDESKYQKKSKELAQDIKSFFTYPNRFLFGETKPDVRRRSDKGLMGIDLGYNVEESLNSIVMYALESGDEELLSLALKSLETHLEFMLPDGGWDNGWGTRMYQWTYWGSRNCDGSQPAYSLMAGHNPAFGTAVIRNTQLLRECTSNGFLHGGPHYKSHGVKSCLTYTFTHAKALAFMQDHWYDLPVLDTNVPLPREIADGVKYFEELDTALFARGDWRGTVSGYDAAYHFAHVPEQATGNALTLLYHKQVGLLCVASISDDKSGAPKVKEHSTAKDFPLTPRIEAYDKSIRYTNIFDQEATFTTQSSEGDIVIMGSSQLKNEHKQTLGGSAANFLLQYNCSSAKMTIVASTESEIHAPTSLVIPLISPTGESIDQPAPEIVEVMKPGGLIRLSANVPLSIKKTTGTRVFNKVPGLEAIPVEALFLKGMNRIVIDFTVVS